VLKLNGQPSQRRDFDPDKDIAFTVFSGPGLEKPLQDFGYGFVSEGVKTSPDEGRGRGRGFHSDL
jgi:hypothetical protein